MLKTRVGLLVVPALLLGTLGAAGAQDYGHRDDRGNFYNGVRDGGRNGYYYQDNHPQYDNRYRNNDSRYYDHGDRRYRDDQGGIGPGKGALIGGAGGAVLGALIGHGLGGALVGGAAGAGIGAIAGEAHQNSERDRYDYPR